MENIVFLSFTKHEKNTMSFCPLKLSLLFERLFENKIEVLYIFTVFRDTGLHGDKEISKVTIIRPLNGRSSGALPSGFKMNIGFVYVIMEFLINVSQPMQ